MFSDSKKDGVLVSRIIAAVAVLSLAVTPAVAELANPRATAPVEDESELAGSGLLLALVGAAAAVGIIIAVSDDDDPVSP